jgi:hypothetical protein
MSKTKVRAKWASDSIEPELNENYTQGELISVLNWYNVMTDSKTLVKYLNTYLKEIKSDKVLTSSVSQQTAGAIARLITRGLGDKKLQEWMDNWVARLDTKVVVPPAVKKVVSIQERTAIKLNDYITGLDNAFENFIESDFKMKFNTEKYLADSNVKASYIREINMWASNVRNEYVLSKTLPIMKEGYSTYTTPQKNKVIKFFDNMIDSLEKYKVAVTPARKKKVVPASKVVSKVKYAKAFPELKLKSVDPEKLIGSKEVWLYNTATKMLSYYTSLDGMTIGGSTLKGFDFSEQRRLRTPEKQLKLLTSMRKGQWIIRFTTMAKTVRTKGSGRLNNSTIILKVF